MDSDNHDINQVMRIVPRKEWSGSDVQLQNTWEPPVRPAPFVYFGSTVTNPCTDPVFCAGTLRKMQYDHFKKYPTDIRFNFIVAGDGRVYEGRGWSVSPRLTSATINDTSRSILIGFVGVYKEEPLPDDMLYTVNNLIDYGQKMEFLDKNLEFKSIIGFVNNGSLRR